MENNDRLKQRLVGAAVLISLVVVFLPMLVERGPAPTAGRQAVPPVPQWQIADWKGEEYQPPAVVDTTPQQVIDPAEQDPGAQQNPGGAVAFSNNSQGTVEVPPQQDEQQAGATNDAADLREATVEKGDTLYGIFRRLGIASSEVREVLKANGASDKFSRLRPGQELRFRIDDKGLIKAMEYRYSGGSALRIKRIGGRLQTLEEGAGRPSATAAKEPAPAKPVAPVVEKPKVAKAPRPTKDQGPVAWAVQVGIYSDWDAARGLQAKLRSKGYPAFLKTQAKDGGKAWRLQVGPEVKKSSALALAQKVQKETGEKATVVSYP